MRFCIFVVKYYNNNNNTPSNLVSVYIAIGAKDQEIWSWCTPREELNSQ